MNLSESYNSNHIYETGKPANMRVTVPLKLPVWATNPQEGTGVEFVEPETLSLKNGQGIEPKNIACELDATSSEHGELTCTFDLTSQDENELEVMPEFGVRAMSATLTITDGSGISHDSEIRAYSGEIVCGGSDESETVRWIDENSLEFKCSDFGDGDESNDICCYNVPWIEWCTSGYKYWCMGPEIADLEGLGYNCIDDSDPLHGAGLRWITQGIYNKYSHSGAEIKRWCCKEKEPKPSVPEPAQVCTINGVCEGDENCTNCPQDCTCRTDRECINGVCEPKQTPPDEPPQEDTQPTETITPPECTSNTDSKDEKDYCSNGECEPVPCPGANLGDKSYKKVTNHECVLKEGMCEVVDSDCRNGGFCSSSHWCVECDNTECSSDGQACNERGEWVECTGTNMECSGGVCKEKVSDGGNVITNTVGSAGCGVRDILGLKKCDNDNS